MAAVSATALLVTAFHAVPATAAPTESCTRTLLELPADVETYPGSYVRGASRSGRYILGHASRLDRSSSQGLLWVDGVPRWLGSRPDGDSYGYAVNEDGFVVGRTTTPEATEHWLYSAQADTYKILPVPENFQIAHISSMNRRKDFVGQTWDPNSETYPPFVWPAGGRPQSLPQPSGVDIFSVDTIAEDGRISGQGSKQSVNEPHAYLWTSWNRRPQRITGPNQEPVSIRTIEGPWLGGGGNSWEPAGFVWNTRTHRTTQIEDYVADINSSGDLVTAGREQFEVPSVLIRANGTRTALPANTYLTRIFNRDAPWTAAGYDPTIGNNRALVYKCS
ncbi:hypothetical protein E1261_40355 [Kribbella albertanoniae]|uniref:DUF4185 domain-containing protein n=1 Tax=Kribbella albertanoniae TaxID=1266829 RepID=A0A4R4P024_9ACTN|nr:hypothetical protein E1261_40355 [Kribbella albertanoniae]